MGKSTMTKSLVKNPKKTKAMEIKSRIKVVLDLNKRTILRILSKGRIVLLEIQQCGDNNRTEQL
jgi:hypothetical protein